MFFFCDYIIAFMHDMEIKLSVSAFAAFISYHFGASEYLLTLIQYLIFIDFALGAFRAKKNKRFSWFKAWIGFKKVISLYLTILIVGFACKAFDLTMQERLILEYNGTFFFDLFLCILVLLNLASINHHLACFGFGINTWLDKIVFKYAGKVQTRLEHEISKRIDNGFNDEE